MEKPVSASSSSSYGQACMQCYKAKCRCVSRPGSDGCERCVRLKKQCQPSESVRRRAHHTPEPSVQIARLEGRIDDLTTLLQSVVKATGVSTNLPPHLNSLLNAANSNSDDGTGFSMSDAAPTSSQTSPFHTGDSSQPSPPTFYESTVDEAESYLEVFRSRMLPCFPFIFFRPNLSAKDLNQDRPFLLGAIVAVATPPSQERASRIEGLKHALTKSIVLENQYSIDLLLSLLIYITWSTDPFLKRTSSLSRMIMLAISLVYDLQLVRSSPEDPYIEKMAPGLGHSSRVYDNASAGDHLERQRAVLACFVLSSVMSSYFKRSDALRWTPSMEDGLRLIGLNKECPSDEAFAFQVRSHLLAQKVAQLQLQQDAHHNSKVTVATQPPPAYLYLGILHGQLQELKALLPTLPLQNPYALAMTSAHIHYIELCLNEIVGHATSEAPIIDTPVSTDSLDSTVPRFERIESLWRCLQAVKSWLDVFYTVSPATYIGFPFFYWFQLIRCIVILKHLMTFQDSAWDCQAVCRTVDMMQLLEWIAEKAELASREAGDQSQNDSFWRVSKMIRQSQEWIRQKRRAAAENAEGTGSIPSDSYNSTSPDGVLLDPHQMSWMNAFENGDESWFEEFFEWSPGTL